MALSGISSQPSQESAVTTVTRHAQSRSTACFPLQADGNDAVPLSGKARHAGTAGADGISVAGPVPPRITQNIRGNIRDIEIDNPTPRAQSGHIW